MNGIYLDCDNLIVYNNNGGPGNYTLYACPLVKGYLQTCEGCRYNVEGNRIAHEMRTDPNDYRKWLKLHDKSN